MAPQRICRHSWVPNKWMHLHQNQCHPPPPEHHLRHITTVRELTVPKPKVCHPDMCMYILLFPTLNLSILWHMPSITSAIKISFHIRRLMKEYPLVNTHSAAWYCSWNLCCRREQPFERTQPWRWALIERNRSFDYYYDLRLADILKCTFKDVCICIIEEQCSDKGESTWRR